MKYKLLTSAPIPRHMVRLLLTSSFLPCFSWRRLSYRACWVSELTVYVSELIVLWNFSLTCNVQTVATQTHQNRLPNKDVRKVGMREGVITCTKKGSLSLVCRTNNLVRRCVAALSSLVVLCSNTSQCLGVDRYPWTFDERRIGPHLELLSLWLPLGFNFSLLLFSTNGIIFFR